MVLGGVLFNAIPARADLPVIDPASIAEEAKQLVQETGINQVLAAIQAIQTAMSNTMTAINKAIGVNTYGDTNTLLREGFTQEANYAKAQIGAQEQITDASNTAMAHFDQSMRDAQIRDEQTASPTACDALDNGVSVQAASVPGNQVGAIISRIQDLRDEAGPGMPSHYGAAEGVASMSQEHIDLYCNQDDAAAGLCQVSATPNADQQAESLFGSGTYAGQEAVNTAKDYGVLLIEPVAPAAIRDDQLSSVAGQDAELQRRAYNARISVANYVIASTIGMQTPAVPLTADQQAYLQNKGLPAQTTGSWLQVLQIEAERRFGDVNWAAQLQNMPPASVEREIALEQVTTNYLLYQIFAIEMKNAAIGATGLAEQTEHDYAPTAVIPTPSIAAN
jgi:hypothetical protein